MEQDLSKQCYNYSLRLLTGQDYSHYKLINKLKSRKYEKDVIEQTIDRLDELNLINEDAYKAALIKKYLRKNYAPHWIKQRLQQEGLTSSEQEINGFSEETGNSREEQIQRVILKKSRLLEAKDGTTKVIRYLMARGFDYQEVQNALKAISTIDT